MLRKYLKGSILIKILGVLIISFAIHIVSAYFDLFELFNGFVAKNEKYNIDELVTIFFAWFIYLFILIIYHQKTIHKQNSKLKELNSKLKESIKQKNQLFSIIGHDLKSPFNAIVGFSDILLSDYKTVDKQRLKNMLANINTASKRSYELLNNILDWGNILNANLLVQKEIIKINKIIAEETIFLEPLTLNKNIVIKNFIKDDSLIFADYQMIKTVIRNILSNAIKYSFKDSSIIISAKKMDGYLKISISDTGIGMTAEQIDNLFEKQGVSSPGTDGEKGTGLGLYICEEFVEKNNGSIHVNSILNEGTEFIINIPVNNNEL